MGRVGGEETGEGRGMVAREEKMYSKEGSCVSSIPLDLAGVTRV